MRLAVQRPSSSAEKSNLVLYSTGSYTIENFYGYNDSFITLLLVKDSVNDLVNVYIKQSKYDKLVTELSSSYSGTLANDISGNNWNSGSFLIIGSTESMNRFVVQEIRYWNKQITDEVLQEHALSPNSYYSNNSTGSFYDLSLRIPLVDKFDINATQSILSEHPNYSYNTLVDGRVLSASFYNFSQSDFEGINETHYIVNPSIGNRSIFSDRIIIDTRSSSDYDHLVLSNDVSTENTYDNENNANNNRIGIYFSPQNIINEDIFKHAGYFRLDDYIGDPLSIYQSSYPKLNFFANEYWKKYQSKNNFGDYIRLFKLYDFTIFSQINQSLPERSNKILGLLIEPNILERNRIKSNTVVKENTFYNIHFTKESLYHITSSNIYPVTSSVNDERITTLTSSYNHYSTTVNSYKDYLSSSQYIFHDLLFITSSGVLEITTGSFTINVLQTFVSSSTESTYKEEKEYFYSSSLHAYVKKFYSSSFKSAKVQDYLPGNIYNLKWGGCKLTSTDINIENNDIFQNRPVVEVVSSNTGELFASEYDADGNFDVK